MRFKYDETSIASINTMNKLGDPTDISESIYFLADNNNPYNGNTILSTKPCQCETLIRIY